MKMLTMTNLSTECLIQLSKLGYDATPFNQILKQNAKREMRLRLGKVTVADVLAVQPVTTNLDRKSGSAVMPRPISYAVFCLKKKKKREGDVPAMVALDRLVRVELVDDLLERRGGPVR